MSELDCKVNGGVVYLPLRSTQVDILEMMAAVKENVSRQQHVHLANPF